MSGRNENNPKNSGDAGADKFTTLCTRYPALVFLLMAVNGSFITLIGGYMYKTIAAISPIVAKAIHEHLG